MKRSTSPAQNPSPVESQMLNTGSSQLQQQQQQQGTAQGQVNKAQSTLDTSAPTLNRITQVQPNGQTALRQSLSNSLTQSTNAAYNNAQANVRRNALQMGLQNQPLQLGNETAVAAQRAKALGQIPSQVEQQAAPEELQAVGLQNQQAGLENSLAGTELSNASLYNPQSYFSQGTSLENSRQNALNQQYLQQQQANAGLWKGLLGAGLSFIPGVGSLLSKGLNGGGGNAAGDYA